jgi:hypothetical protein
MFENDFVTMIDTIIAITHTHEMERRHLGKEKEGMKLIL